MPAKLTKLVQEFGVEPGKMRLEITESVMMTNAEAQLEILRDLQAAGFIIEMDDFGSGYSSLNLLREMPVDVLKIDMVFLQQANKNMRAKAIVEDVIGLSGRLGITSLTEGVETKEQYDDLMEMGCQMYQGYSDTFIPIVRLLEIREMRDNGFRQMISSGGTSVIQIRFSCKNNNISDFSRQCFIALLGIEVL